jgi:hypothetical protein
MAVAPLFVADMVTLKGKLRLSGVATGTDAQAQIEEAVQSVRTGFYRRLGLSRLTYLQGLPFVEAPSSDTGYLRMLANTVEVIWTRLELMKTMPQLFMDARGSTVEIWNTEAAFRQGSLGQKEIERLEAQLEDELAILAGTQQAGNETSWGMFTATPTEGVICPGETIWGPCIEEGEGSSLVVTKKPQWATDVFDLAHGNLVDGQTQFALVFPPADNEAIEFMVDSASYSYALGHFTVTGQVVEWNGPFTITDDQQVAITYPYYEAA